MPPCMLSCISTAAVIITLHILFHCHFPTSLSAPSFFDFTVLCLFHFRLQTQTHVSVTIITVHISASAITILHLIHKYPPTPMAYCIPCFLYHHKCLACLPPSLLCASTTISIIPWLWNHCQCPRVPLAPFTFLHTLIYNFWCSCFYSLWSFCTSCSVRLHIFTPLHSYWSSLIIPLWSTLFELLFLIHSSMLWSNISTLICHVFTLLHSAPLQSYIIIPFRSVWSTLLASHPPWSPLIAPLILLYYFSDLHCLLRSYRLGSAQFVSTSSTHICLYLIYTL